jgi:hypothetical protein
MLIYMLKSVLLEHCHHVQRHSDVVIEAMGKEP